MSVVQSEVEKDTGSIIANIYYNDNNLPTTTGQVQAMFNWLTNLKSCNWNELKIVNKKNFAMYV
jgi:hypothetical protein